MDRWLAAKVACSRRLLRIRAERRLAARAAEVDEEPLPGMPWCAGFLACGARRHPPTPARLDADTLARISRAGRLLRLVKNKKAAGAQHDERQACRNECAHDRSSRLPCSLTLWPRLS